MTTKRWRSRICKECGSIVKIYGRGILPFYPYIRQVVNWCRQCQRRLGIGDWIWGER